MDENGSIEIDGQDILAFRNFIRDNEDRLIMKIIAYAKERGFSQYTSTHPDDWRRSVSGLSASLIEFIQKEDTNLYFDASAKNNSVFLFGIEESARHRERGVNLALFLSLLKYYRESYEYLIWESHFKVQHKTVWSRCVKRFFDGVEIAIINAGINTGDKESIKELEAANRFITNEKNKYLSVFENLPNPVMLINNKGVIEDMNVSAAALFAIMDGMLSHANEESYAGPKKDFTFKERFPVIYQRLQLFLKHDFKELDFEEYVGSAEEKKWFQVRFSRLVDVSGRLDGVIVMLQDVSRKKLSEEKFKVAALRLKSMFNSMEEAIFILTPERDLVDVNPAAERMFGYSKEDLQDISAEVLHVDHAHFVEFGRRMDNAFRKGETASFEYKMRRKNGEVFPSRHTVAQLKMESGEILGRVAIVRDITERKLVEKAIKDSRAKYMDLYDNAPDMYVSVDMDTGKILQINSTLLKRLGYSRKEILNRHFLELYHSDCLEEIEKVFRSFLETGEIRDKELCLKKKNGVPIDISLDATAVRDENGHIIRGRCSLRDITKRKMAEREKKSSEERLRMLMEQSPLAIELYNENGLLLRTNQSWRRIFNVDEPESFYGSYNIFEDEQAIDLGYAEAVKAAFKGEDTDIPEKEFHTSLLQPKGEKRFLHTRVFSLKEKDGDISTAVLMHEDITDRKLFEIKLRQREATLRTLLENIPIDFWARDNEGKCIFQSRTSRELWGTLGIFGKDQDPHSENLRVWKPVNKKAYEGETVVNDVSLVVKSGEQRFFRSIVSPIKDEERILGVLGVNLDMTDRKRMEDELKRLATTDSLTGAYNRHRFLNKANQEFTRFKRYHNSLCVFMLDIDHFKIINDTYGHPAGDEVLKALVKECTSILRTNDIFGRFGGEEFTAVLIETDDVFAAMVCERLRAALADLKVETADGVTITFTVSIGLTRVTENDSGIEAAIKRADEALYEAKNSGRNRVVVM